MNDRRPPFNPRSMEKMMKDLSRMLEQQNFESVDEANAFLQQLVDSGTPIPEMGPVDDPLSQAQELVYDAYNAPSQEEATALAREALEISEDCADAYVILAELEAENLEEARTYYEQGVAAGERALGPAFFEEEMGYFWGILETRPYMRARAGLAEVLWILGEHDAAIDHYEEMLRLNPDDNQGLRYLLAECLLALGRDDDLEALLDRYEDEASAGWQYNRALLLYRREDESDRAEAALEEALEISPYVADYLLGRKKLPKRPPPYVGFGDENEAVDYVLSHYDYWQSTYGALRWMRQHARHGRRR